MSLRLGLMLQEGLEARTSLALDRTLLEQARALPDGLPGVLRVCERQGALVSLGRYHVRPRGGTGAVRCVRRFTGGRVVPDGAGFVGVSLVLPHRDALATAPGGLRPEQVLNRHVRGVLEGCRLLGMRAFYPGRDTITVEGRVLGMVSFEEEATGALLVEAILAREEDFGCLPARLDAADPGGTVHAAMVSRDEVVSMGRVLGRTPALTEVADAIARGYAQVFGAVGVAVGTVPVGGALDQEPWLDTRVERPDLGARARVPTQLGVIEAALAIEDGRIREAQVSGDFIANPTTVAALESGLRGCPAEAAALAAIVQATFAQPGRFILGVGPLQTVIDVLVRALPS